MISTEPTSTAPTTAAPALIKENVAPAPAVSAKAATKSVAKSTAKVAKKAPTPKAAAPKVTTKATTKASTKATAKPAAKVTTKPAPKTAAKPAAKPVAAKVEKARKPKMVRDSFTIPKNEYDVLDSLKQRAVTLGSTVKKTELIRAGMKALVALQDAAFLAALAAVPSLKTGRPAKSKKA